jgi:S-methylmethionine-dependent homocysteine/selenocysteine methylase
MASTYPSSLHSHSSTPTTEPAHCGPTYQSYLDIAQRLGRGVVLDTPTWRANLDWGTRLGFEPDTLRNIKKQAVRFVRDVASGFPEVTAVVNGAVGPRGDGYVIANTMSVAEVVPDGGDR